VALDWLKVLEWLKPRPSLFFALMVASGVLLFAPAEVSGVLSLDPFVAEYGWLLGVVFLMSTSLLLGTGLAWIFTNSGSPLYQWWQTRRLQGFLRDLSPPEKVVLRQFMADDATTQYFEYQDGVVQGLVHKRVLWRASNVAAHFTTFPFNIQPWAREYLRKNPKLLT